MVLNKIVNINVQRENRVLFSAQNYFLYMQQTKEDVTHDSHRRIDGQHYLLIL